MGFTHFEGFVKPQFSPGSLIFNFTNCALCFHCEYHSNNLLSLLHLQCHAAFVHDCPAVSSSTHPLPQLWPHWITTSSWTQQNPVDQGENHASRLSVRSHRDPFPVFVLLDLGLAKAPVCCSTCAVSLQAETKAALLSSAGNEGAHYTADLHAPMQRSVFQAHRIIYWNKWLPFSIS